MNTYKKYIPLSPDRFAKASLIAEGVEGTAGGGCGGVVLGGGGAVTPPLPVVGNSFLKNNSLLVCN